MSYEPNSPSSSYPPPERPRTVSVAVDTARPVVTYVLMGVTILVFLGQLALESAVGTDLLLLYGAKIREAILVGQFWRLLTPVFLHASFMHIAFNMYALYAVGPGLESFYGRWRFLALYFLAAAAGNTLSFVVSPSISVGASTAVFGLITAQAVFIYRNRQLFGERMRPMLTNLLVILGLNLVLGLSSRIDNWGHLGGLLGGLAFAWFAGPVLQVEGWGDQLHLRDTNTGRAFVTGALMAAVLGGLVFLQLLWA